MERQQFRIAPVPIVRGARLPRTVISRVTARIVSAFDSVLRRRTRTHVSQELLEVIPLLADSNSSPTIVSEVWRVWIIATASHILPDAVLHRSLACRCWLRMRDVLSFVPRRGLVFVARFVRGYAFWMSNTIASLTLGSDPAPGVWKECDVGPISQTPTATASPTATPTPRVPSDPSCTYVVSSATTGSYNCP